MATYYWVGGTGLWDLYGTTNWAATSGGAGGAGAPGINDDVVFDSSSNATAYTVTVMETAVCRNLTVAGPASGNVTLSGNWGIFIYGSVSMAASGITLSLTGSLTTRAVTFAATTTGHTINMNGLTWNTPIVFDGVGGGWTMSSGFFSAQAVFLNNGSLNLGGFSFACTAFLSGNSNTRALNISSSSIILSATGPTGIAPFLWDLSTTAGLTFTSTNSFITVTGVAGSNQNTFNGGGLTYNHVTFSGNSQRNNVIITGANTFAFLQLRGPSSVAAGTTNAFWFTDNQTITDLSVINTTYYQRVMIASTVVGTPRTLTVATSTVGNHVDFRDITIAGAAAPIADTTWGDCGGNTGITFAAPKSVYLTGTTVSWTGSGTAPWAATSGGAIANANFPLAQDTAFIASAGSNGAVTIPGFFNVGTIDCSLATVAGTAFASSSNYLSLTGNFVGNAQVATGSLSLMFIGQSPQTIISAGQGLYGVIVYNNSSVTLQDAIIINSLLGVVQGTFNTNNFNITASGTGFLILDTSGTLPPPETNFLPRAINLGSSNIVASAAFSIQLDATNLTFNAGTSSISCTAFAVNSRSSPFTDPNLTFYNVTSTTPSVTLPAAQYTFNNLTLNPPTSDGIQSVSLNGNITVNGTFSASGGATPIRRVAIVSGTPGTSRTITAAAVSALADVDFQDITIAGASAPWSGTRLGDCGNNTGITFPAPKTVYWNLAGTQNVTATGWASTSGGVPNVNNFPLAQDTAVFDDAGAAGTVTLSSYNFGTIDMSARTSAMTLTAAGDTNIFGDWITGSGVTYSGTSSIRFEKAGTQTFTSAGKTVTFSIIANSSLTTLSLTDPLTISSISASNGATFSANNQPITCGGITVSGTSTYNMGSADVTFTGTVNVSTTSTVNKGTSNIILASTTGVVFTGGGKSYNKLTIAGGASTGSVAISGDNTFTEIESTRTAAYTLNINDSINVGAFNVSGSAGNVVTLTASGSQIGSMTKTGGGTVSVDYLNISKSYVYPSATWNPGSNSTNSGATYQWFAVTPPPSTGNGNFFMMFYP